MQSVESNSFIDDVNIDMSDLNLTVAPIVIPISTGWITTLEAASVTASNFKARGVNWSNGTHSGTLKYLVFIRE